MGEDTGIDDNDWHLPEEDRGEFDEHELEAAIRNFRRNQFAELENLN